MIYHRNNNPLGRVSVTFHQKSVVVKCQYSRNHFVTPSRFRSAAIVSDAGNRTPSPGQTHLS